MCQTASNILFLSSFIVSCCCCSVIQLCSILCNHGLQHSKLPCPSPSPKVCSDSCPLSWWCHPTISSSVTPFSFCLQSFPTSGSFPVNQFFASGGQIIGASASVLPMNNQGWFSLALTGLISLLSGGLSGIFSSTSPWVAWASPVKVRALLALRQHSRVHQN